MAWSIMSENNKLVIVNNEKEELEMYDLDTLSDDMYKIIATSDATYVKIPYNEENYKKICSFSNRLRNTNHLVIIDVVDLSDDEIKNKKNTFKGLENKINCKFKYKYDNNLTTSIDEIIKAIDYVEKKANIVKSYNLSPIETLMPIYDDVRDREYKEEPIGERKELSRDLTKIIDSPYIVCDGYAQLFSAIANKVGIYTEDYLWESTVNKDKGHVSNICYINDPKYDIHGVFEVDVTGGRKKDNNNSFLRDYSSFLIPLYMAVRFKKSENLVAIKNQKNLFAQINKRYQRYCQNNYENNIVENGFASLLLRDLIKYLSIIGLDTYDFEQIEELINKSKKNIDRKKIKSDLVLCVRLYDIPNSINNSNLDNVSFLRALHAVRSVEHSIDKDKYPLSLEEIHNIYTKRSGKNFSKLKFGVLFAYDVLGDYDKSADYVTYEDYYDTKVKEQELKHEVKRRVKTK